MYGLFKRLYVSSHNLPNRLENFLVPNWTSSLVPWTELFRHDKSKYFATKCMYLPWQMGNYAGNYMKLHLDESRLQQNPSNFVWTTWTSSQVSELFEKRVKLKSNLCCTLNYYAKNTSSLNVLSRVALLAHDLAMTKFLKLKQKVFFLYPNKRQCDTLLILFVRFCTVLFAILSNHCARNCIIVKCSSNAVSLRAHYDSKDC